MISGIEGDVGLRPGTAPHSLVLRSCSACPTEKLLDVVTRSRRVQPAGDARDSMGRWSRDACDKLVAELFPGEDRGVREAVEPRLRGPHEGQGEPVSHGLVVVTRNLYGLRV